MRFGLRHLNTNDMLVGKMSKLLVIPTRSIFGDKVTGVPSSPALTLWDTHVHTSEPTVSP